MEKPCSNCLLRGQKEVPFRGNRKAEIIFLLESPGNTELQQCQMLVGDSLPWVQNECQRVGIDFNGVFLMNAARCKIDKDKLTPGQISQILQTCRPHVELAVRKLTPKLIICFGAIAFQQVYKKTTLKKARNQFYWSDEFNCWIAVTYHPGAIMRDPAKAPYFKADFDSLSNFIRNGYKAVEEVTYKEVSSIRPLLEGECYSEGNFYCVGLDTETQGTAWYDKNSVLLSYQVSKDLTEGWAVVLQEEVEKDCGDYNIIVPRGGTQKKPEYVEVGIKKVENYEQKVSELKELLARKDIKKYFFNQKFEQHRFMSLGITEWNNCCMDAKIAATVLDSELYRDCSLDDLISQFATTGENYKGAVSEAEKEDMLALLKNDRQKFIKYASLDPVFTLKVSLALKKELLKDKKSLNYFIKFAQPIETEFLFEMERNGVLVDRKKIPEVKEKLRREMSEKETEFKRLCPLKVRQRHEDNFKLTRTAILQEALFEWRDTKLKKDQTEPERHNYGFNLEPIVMSQKSGTPSTDKKAVMSAILDGPYPKKVKKLIETHIAWNERKQLLGNFIANIERYLDDNDRLHSSFSITFTTSGRVGSRQPNLQNQPKRGPLAKIIRELFIAPESKKIVECDYNASELRWVAHVADEDGFKQIFKEGKDPHRITGLEIRGLPEDYVFQTEDELKKTRQSAKSLNFGLIYKMTVNGLKRYAKQNYGVAFTDKEAQENYNKFFRRFSNVTKWHERDSNFLYKHGYLRTVFGRKRTLPNIHSDDRYKQMGAERTGINIMIQGPSSDATLLGGYTFSKDEQVDKNECRIILFIHDALLFEIDEYKINTYIPIIRKHMEHIPTKQFGFKMSVPLLIEVEIGDRLSEMKEIQEN